MTKRTHPSSWRSNVDGKPHALHTDTAVEYVRRVTMELDERGNVESIELTLNSRHDRLHERKLNFARPRFGSTEWQAPFDSAFEQNIMVADISHRQWEDCSVEVLACEECGTRTLFWAEDVILSKPG